MHMDENKKWTMVKQRKWMILSLLVTVISLMAAICSTATLLTMSSEEPQWAEEESPDEQAQEKEIQQSDHALVDIAVNGDGHYSLMGDVKVQFDGEQVESISIKEPMLLAFSVSSKHQGGVWIMDRDEGEDMLASMEELHRILSQSGNTDLAKQVHALIERFEMAGPISGAST